MKRKLLCVITAVVAICAFIVTAYATVVTYTNTETEHVATLPSREIDNVTYSGVGGLAIGRKHNSMFVMKAETQEGNPTEQNALLYDFPDIDNPSNVHYYRLNHAGHANAMTIDDTNIYVCGWTKIDHYDGSNQSNNKYNNWVLMIPRKMFTSLRKGANGVYMHKYNKNTPDIPGYSILYPKVKTILADGSVKYSDYMKTINSISKYNDSETFIIGYNMAQKSERAKQIRADLGDDMAFTTARLEEYNGRTYFVVSEEQEDIFVVKNNVANKDAVDQDIGYAPGHGLFIPKWYGGSVANPYYKPTKTVIMWANIDSEASSKIIDGTSYRYYIPNRIVIDKSKDKDSNGNLLYTKFEPESIAFTKDENGYDGSLLFSCNTLRNSSADGAYKDSVFKLTHDGGQGFSLN